MKKGIALITVIWILAIMLILIGVLAYLTSSDTAYTLIFNKRRLALGAAEHGKNVILSQIPQYELLGLMAQNDFLFYDASTHGAFKFDITGRRSYLISPMPFPHGHLQWGIGGVWYKVYNFTAGGRCITARGDVERVADIGAAYENPATASTTVGHTMY